MESAAEQRTLADEAAERGRRHRLSMISRAAEFCKGLVPFKFTETNHDLRARVSNDRVPKIALGADHAGGDPWDGWVTFVTVSVHDNGKYEVTLTGGSPDYCATFEDMRKKVFDKLSDLDRKTVAAIFKHVQSHRR